ncbi:acyltransferase [Marinobacter sp. 1-4A]|uniref:acyltransferase family protein n=1 Tax=Marinobacter sp. 1-4A TaxID=2582919 RepID=UPI00190604AA|nr:acyltransferase [Marinobacter sp. 1-4A]MBK1849813.1 acyltransferase [Marinobacter sp. 1-4A]
MVAKKKTNLTQLTWLRGIAAFWVICSHVNRATEVAYTEKDTVSSSVLLSIFDLGTLGVALFFTLSGVTLFISNRDISTESPIRFYVKRFFRIWPAYAFALIIYICAGFLFREWYVGDPKYWVADQFTKDYTVKDVLMYLSLSFNISGTGGLFNNAFWSLPVEFQYYLAFPLIVLLLRFVGIIGPVLLGAFAYLLYRSGAVDLSSNLLLIFAFTFCSGACIGSLYKSSDFRFNLWFFILTTFTIILMNVLMVNQIVPIEMYIFIPNEWVFFGISSVALVALVTFSDIELPSKLDRFLEHYGKVSYSTYLYHNLVIAFLVVGISYFEIHNSSTRLIYMIIFSFLITHAISLVSYKFIEKKFINFGRIASNYSFNKN